jgi:hypothetical protein
MGGPRDRDCLRVALERVAQDPSVEAYDLWPVIERATGG